MTPKNWVTLPSPMTPARVKRPKQGKPFDAHVTHLVVHGMLHLLGFDHIDDADARLMEATEVRILETLGLPTHILTCAPYSGRMQYFGKGPMGSSSDGTPAAQSAQDMMGEDVSEPGQRGFFGRIFNALHPRHRTGCRTRISPATPVTARTPMAARPCRALATCAACASMMWRSPRSRLPPFRWISARMNWSRCSANRAFHACRFTRARWIIRRALCC